MAVSACTVIKVNWHVLLEKPRMLASVGCCCLFSTALAVLSYILPSLRNLPAVCVRVVANQSTSLVQICYPNCLLRFGIELSFSLSSPPTFIFF